MSFAAYAYERQINVDVGIDTNLEAALLAVSITCPGGTTWTMPFLDPRNSCRPQ